MKQNPDKTQSAVRKTSRPSQAYLHKYTLTVAKETTPTSAGFVFSLFSP